MSIKFKRELQYGKIRQKLHVQKPVRLICDRFERNKGKMRQVKVRQSWLRRSRKMTEQYRKIEFSDLQPEPSILCQYSLYTSHDANWKEPVCCTGILVITTFIHIREGCDNFIGLSFSNVLCSTQPSSYIDESGLAEKVWKFTLVAPLSPEAKILILTPYS